MKREEKVWGGGERKGDIKNSRSSAIKIESLKKYINDLVPLQLTFKESINHSDDFLPIPRQHNLIMMGRGNLERQMLRGEGLVCILVIL